MLFSVAAATFYVIYNIPIFLVGSIFAITCYFLVFAFVMGLKGYFFLGLK